MTVSLRYLLFARRIDISIACSSLDRSYIEDTLCNLMRTLSSRLSCPSHPIVQQPFPCKDRRGCIKIILLGQLNPLIIDNCQKGIGMSIP
jgi:hypothetical protein